MKLFCRQIAACLVLVILCLLSAGAFAGKAYATGTDPAGQQTGTTAAPGEKPESEMTEEEKKAKAEKEAYEKELKECYELAVESNSWPNWPAGPGTYGYGACVMDADSGVVLYAKDMQGSYYPASITKMLTMLVAQDYLDLSEKVTISKEALACLGSGYAAIGLKEGNVITMEQALYAMLLASANEAAYAVAETIAADQGQSYDWFIAQMNEKVQSLGGVNSNFINTNGVFNENHTTCAYDMALIGSALFDYPIVQQICQTQQYVIEKTKKVEEHVFQQKHHMLLIGNKDYDERVVAGKTGYTTEANNTLITMAESNGRRLVCVILKTYGGYPYSDTKALLDYGFNEFTTYFVADNDTRGDFSKVEERAAVTVPNGVKFDDLKRSVELAEDGTDKAVVSYYYNDMLVGTCNVEVSQAYKDRHDIVTNYESVVDQESEAGDGTPAEGTPVVAEEPEKPKTAIEKIEDKLFELFDLLKSTIIVWIIGGLFAGVIIARIVTGIARRRKKKRRHSQNMTKARPSSSSSRNGSRSRSTGSRSGSSPRSGTSASGRTRSGSQPRGGSSSSSRSRTSASSRSGSRSGSSSRSGSGSSRSGSRGQTTSSRSGAGTRRR